MLVRGAVLNPSMLLMVEILFDGEKTTLSPTATFPASIRPAKIRRSSPCSVNL